MNVMADWVLLRIIDIATATVNDLDVRSVARDGLVNEVARTPRTKEMEIRIVMQP